MPLNTSLLSQWEEDPEFNNFTYDQKAGILNNYFREEEAPKQLESWSQDPEFQALPDVDKQSVVQNYYQDWFNQESEPRYANIFDKTLKSVERIGASALQGVADLMKSIAVGGEEKIQTGYTPDDLSHALTANPELSREIYKIMQEEGLPKEQYNDVARMVVQRAQRTASAKLRAGAEQFPEPGPPIFREGVAGFTEEAATSLAPFAPAMVSGPAAPFAIFHIARGEKYQDLLDQGIPKEAASRSADEYAIMTAMTEAMELGILFRMGSKAFKAFAKKNRWTERAVELGLAMLEGGLTNAPQEAAQEYLEVITDERAKDPDAPMQDIIQRARKVWETPEFKARAKKAAVLAGATGVAIPGLAGAAGLATAGVSENLAQKRQILTEQDIKGILDRIEGIQEAPVEEVTPAPETPVTPEAPTPVTEEVQDIADIVGTGVKEGTITPKEAGEIQKTVSPEQADLIKQKLEEAKLGEKKGEEAIPAKEKEVRVYIKAAAIQLKDGTVLTGKNHGDIYSEMSDDQKAQIASDDGFVTGNGVYLTRAETVALIPEGRVGKRTKDATDIMGTAFLVPEQQLPEKLKPAEVTPAYTGPERRTNLKERKKVSEMTEEEKTQALLTDELTGLGNKRAYEEAEKAPVQINMDVDGLKWVNDTYGHEAGNELLRTVGEALKKQGDIDSYHISGDEFSAQAQDSKKAQVAMDAALEDLKTKKVGGFTGPSFSYGIGKTQVEAEKAMMAMKEGRRAAGELVKRGEKPVGAEEKKAALTPQTYDEAQKAIDRLETKLINAGQEKKLDTNPELQRLYAIRDQIGQQELETSYKDIFEKVNRIIKNPTVTKSILKRAYDLDPTNPMGQYLASQYTQEDVKKEKETVRKITRSLIAEETGMGDHEIDVLFTNLSPLTDKGKRDLVERNTRKAEQINDAMKGYFGLTKAAPTPKQQKLQVSKIVVDSMSRKQVGNLQQFARAMRDALERANAPKEVLDALDVQVKPWINIDWNLAKKSLEQHKKEGKSLTAVALEGATGATTFLSNGQAVMELSLNHLQLKDMAKTAYHELYHIYRESGYISEGDLKVLANHFKTEEGEADFFADIARDERLHPDLPGPVRRILLRMKKFIQRVASWLKKEGFTRPEDVVGKLLAGKFTPTGKMGSWKGTKQAVQQPALKETPLSRQVEMTNNPEIGGSTFAAGGEDLGGSDFYAVSIFPDLTQTIKGRLTEKQLQDFQDKYQEYAENYPNVNYGTWYDAATDTTYLDLSVRVPLTEKKKAIQLAKQYNQKAIFDLSTFEEIDTGGTGEVKGTLPSIEERLQTAAALTKLPVTSKGEVKLTHWSRMEGLKLLDPEYFGTQYAGAEKKRQSQDPQNWVNRTYYGIGVGQPGGYVKERELGPVQYTVNVPAKRLYNLVEDPAGLKAKAELAVEKNPHINPFNYYEKSIKEAGYAGYWVDHPQQGLVAAVFEAMKPISPATKTSLAIPKPGERHRLEDSEKEAMFTAAEETKQGGIWEWVTETGTSFKNRISRTFEHIPQSRKEAAYYAEFKRILLRLRQQKGVQGEKALGEIQEIAKGLNPVDFHNFTRIVVFRNFVEEAKLQKAEELEVALPGGLTEDEVKTEVQRAEATITPEIQRSLDERKKHWTDLRDRTIKAFEPLGIDMSEKLKREDYYRHDVLDYINLNGLFGTGKKLRTPTYRSYLRKRGGSEKMISMNYVQAEYEVMAQMGYDIEMARAISEIGDNYDVIGRFKAQAAQLNIQNVIQVLDSYAAAMEVPEGKKPVTGEDLYKQLGTKMAIGFDNLGRLAAGNELPLGEKGEYADLVNALGENWLANKSKKKEMGKEWTSDDRIPLPAPFADQMLPYANYVLKQGETGVGKGAAATIFKGIAERKAAVKDILGRQYLTWQRLVKEDPDYTTWHAREGNMFFKVYTIPEQLATTAMEEGLDQIGVTPDQIKEMYARGSKFTPFVVKNEIADTLNNLTPPQMRAYGKVMTAGMKLWKQWILGSIHRIVKFSIRNVSGDLSKVIAGSPGSMKYIKRSTGELVRMGILKSTVFPKLPSTVQATLKKVFGNPQESAELKEWIDRGGPEALLRTQELDTFNDSLRYGNELMAQYKGAKSLTDIPLAIWKGYWRSVAKMNDLRESMLRYAAYLDYLDQMKANENGLPNNYGASIPEEIKGLKDIRDRAFLLSNQLVGAYDRVTVFGQELRQKYYPFWSFKEVNFTSYKRLLQNAISDTRNMEHVGKQVLGTQYAKLAAKSSGLVLARIGAMALRATFLLSVINAWNHFVVGDADEELPDEIRRRPHLTLGRDSEGKVQYFSRLGALGDLFEWVGLDTVWEDLDDIMKGKKTIKEQAVDMAKAPVEVVVQGGHPFLKLGVELWSRQTLFPSVFNPRPIQNRLLHIARSFAVEEEYVALVNMFIHPFPSKGYAKSWQKTFIYESDPFEAAYFDFFNLKRKFLKTKGKLASGHWITQTGNDLYNARTALRYGDEDAMFYYMDQYFKHGGTKKGLQQSLDNMSPLAGLNKAEQQEFMASLHPDELDKFVKSLVFYQQLMTGVHAEEIWNDVKPILEPPGPKPPSETLGTLGERARIKKGGK